MPYGLWYRVVPFIHGIMASPLESKRAWGHAWGLEVERRLTDDPTCNEGVLRVSAVCATPCVSFPLSLLATSPPVARFREPRDRDWDRGKRAHLQKRTEVLSVEALNDL